MYFIPAKLMCRLLKLDLKMHIQTKKFHGILVDIQVMFFIPVLSCSKLIMLLVNVALKL